MLAFGAVPDATKGPVRTSPALGLLVNRRGLHGAASVVSAEELENTVKRVALGVLSHGSHEGSAASALRVGGATVRLPFASRRSVRATLSRGSTWRFGRRGGRRDGRRQRSQWCRRHVAAVEQRSRSACLRVSGGAGELPFAHETTVAHTARYELSPASVLKAHRAAGTCVTMSPPPRREA